MPATDRFPIDTLVKHVGCGAVDEVGACVYCDQIRARLERLTTLSASLDAAQAENQRLTSECYALSADLRKVQCELDVEWKRASKAEAEITRLQGYVQHKAGCAALTRRDYCRMHGGDGGTNGCPACNNLSVVRACTCKLVLDPAPLPKEPTTP